VPISLDGAVLRFDKPPARVDETGRPDDEPPLALDKPRTAAARTQISREQVLCRLLVRADKPSAARPSPHAPGSDRRGNDGALQSIHLGDRCREPGRLAADSGWTSHGSRITEGNLSRSTGETVSAIRNASGGFQERFPKRLHEKRPARRAEGHDETGREPLSNGTTDGRRQARILGRRRTFSSTTIGTALSARKFS
jgi:hypothetical protein